VSSYATQQTITPTSICAVLDGEGGKNATQWRWWNGRIGDVYVFGTQWRVEVCRRFADGKGADIATEMTEGSVSRSAGGVELAHEV